MEYLSIGLVIYSEDTSQHANMVLMLVVANATRFRSTCVVLVFKVLWLFNHFRYLMSVFGLFCCLPDDVGGGRGYEGDGVSIVVISLF